MLEDRKTFIVAGEPRELFMSFNNLTVMCSVAGGLDKLAASLTNPDIVLVLMAQLMRPDLDTQIQTTLDAQLIMDKVAISASEGHEILVWVEEHVVNFTLARASSLENLANRLQKAMSELMSSLTGQKD